MKKILLIMLIVLTSISILNSQEVDTSEFVQSYDRSWKQKNIQGIRDALASWEIKDRDDPALWYIKIDFYMSIDLNKAHAVAGCAELKRLGTLFGSSELSDLSDDRKKNIDSFAAQDFVKPTDEQINQYLAAFPDGNPTLQYALGLRKFRK